ncbi:peptide-methionine (R)-S-oxide reductase MsrB [Ewingella sp. S1.OA.A_B6]
MSYHKMVKPSGGFGNPFLCSLTSLIADRREAMMINRRNFLLGSCTVSAVAALGLFPTLFTRKADAQAKNERFEVSLTDAQWHQRLSGAQYYILREAGTERPYSSPLNDEHRVGEFACAGCSLPLFSSATKFDSHTGWPSFWKPLPNAALTRRDTSLGMVRDEVHCRRCGGHLGHVFDDGPPPTGQRYCMNGLAMTFTPKAM